MGGVFGVFGHPEASALTYLGLYALQYRGGDAAGIVSSDGYNLYEHKEKGKVGEIFSKEKIEKLCGQAAIGSVDSFPDDNFLAEDIQPINVKRLNNSVALCCDGKIVQGSLLHQELEKSGAVFLGQSDVELLLHLLSGAKKDSLQDRLFQTLCRTRGAFSLLLLTENELIAARDPFGFRPLLLGQLDGAYVFSSESCAFDLLSVKYLREIQPGEVIVVNSKDEKSYFPFGPKTLFPAEPIPHKFCVYEWIYYARPDSLLFDGQIVAKIRTKLGRELAKNEEVQADIVLPLPDTSIQAAVGFSEGTGIKFYMDIIRNHYVEHSPEEPKENIKDFGTRVKFNLVPEVLKGKRVILVVHSIIRGGQIPEIIRMIKNQTEQVHLRISCPPIISSCRYGIDFPGRDFEDFIANRLEPEEIAKEIGVVTVRYLALEGLYRVLNTFHKEHCFACLTGEYPL